MNKPKVSIGLPVYNGQEFLEGALDSILKQDFKDFELIILDNASVDATQDICASYAEKDKRIRYCRNEVNIGAAKNYNKVFQIAIGEYFKWATHDDVLLPGFLGECVKVLDAGPRSVALVYTQAWFIDEKGDLLYRDNDKLETKHKQGWRRLAHILQHVNMANAVFGLIRSEVLRETRLIDAFIASDYVLLAEIAMLGEFCEVKKPLFLRRLHKDASRYANRTNQEVLSWFAPDRKLRGSLAHLHLLFPKTPVRMRLIYEWMRSAYRIPMATQERVACLLTIPFVYGTARVRNYAGSVRSRLRRFVNFNL